MCLTQAELEKEKHRSAKDVSVANASEPLGDVIHIDAEQPPGNEAQQLQSLALDGLRRQMQDSVVERAALHAELDAVRAVAPSPPRDMVTETVGDLVSMAVLEDFREQQMEERAEWEAEKARLVEEIANLKAVRDVSHISLAKPAEAPSSPPSEVQCSLLLLIPPNVLSSAQL